MFIGHLEIVPRRDRLTTSTVNRQSAAFVIGTRHCGDSRKIRERDVNYRDFRLSTRVRPNGGKLASKLAIFFNLREILGNKRPVIATIKVWLLIDWSLRGPGIAICKRGCYRASPQNLHCGKRLSG